MSATGIEQFIEMMWRMSLQAAVLGAVVWLVCRGAKRAPASFRCALWVVVLVKFLVPPLASLPAQLAFWRGEEAVVVETPAAVPVYEPSYSIGGSASSSGGAAVVPGTPSREAVSIEAPRFRMPSAAESIAALWAAGVLVMLVSLAIRWRRQRSALSGAGDCDEQMHELLRRAAYSMDVRRLPGLRVSERTCTAALAGLLRPVIVLPAQVVNSCSSREAEAMLLHELAHIKRRDMAVLWLHELVRVLFFYHPAVWIAGRELEVERELACDELVVTASAIPATEYAAGYVTALKLAQRSAKMRVSLGMAEPFEVGKRRLEMILRSDIPRFSLGWVVALAAVAVLGLPSFAGVAETMPKATPNAASAVSGQTERTAPVSGNDQLMTVVNGVRKACYSIRSAKGDVNVHSWQMTDHDAVLESEHNYRVAIEGLGRKYRCESITLSIKNKLGPNAWNAHGAKLKTGTKWVMISSSDGQTMTSYDAQQNRAQIEEASIYPLAFDLPYVLEAAGSCVNLPGSYDLPNGETVEHKNSILRNESVNGSDCVVLECVQILTRPGKKPWEHMTDLWVDTKKGYSVTRMQVYDMVNGSRQMFSEMNTDLKNYGDGVWGPSKCVIKQYEPNKDGKRGLTFKRIVTYSPDFGINVKLSRDDLTIKLPQGIRVEDKVLGKVYAVE